MSPAQSEDSGLAADRGTTYATISLPRENVQAMGIVFLGKWILILNFIFWMPFAGETDSQINITLYIFSEDLKF